MSILRAAQQKAGVCKRDECGQASPAKHETPINRLIMRFIGVFVLLFIRLDLVLTLVFRVIQQPDPSFANRVVCLLLLYKSLHKKFPDGSVEENRRGKGFC